MKAIKTKQEIKKEEFDRYMDKEYGQEAIKKDILKQIYQNKKNKKDPYDGMSTSSIMVAEIIKDKAKSQLAAMKKPSIAKQVVNYSPNKIDVEEILDKFEDGFESKKKIKIAMSETPEEEAEMLLGGEALEFLKWLKEHPNQTYNDWLKDKSASVKEDKKQDMNVIDLVPFLPTFEEEIKKLEEEEKNKEESREDFMRRRVREIQLAETEKSGIANLLGLKNRI